MTTETTYLSQRSHYPIMDELYALTISNLIKVDQKLTNIKF